MEPGVDCMTCHDFSAAGTVFTDAGGAAADVIVVVGGEELRSNAAGNFFTAKSIPFPAATEVRAGSGVRRMSQLAPSGACNNCHGVGVTPHIDVAAPWLPMGGHLP
jgi:hypothetical protein